VEFVGIDWATRRAAWCAVDAAGRRLGEGAVPADEGGLLRLVADRGLEVTAAVEMMSGAAWIAETLRSVGWTVRVADARRARALAPLAAKTDRIDARVLAELARRELVPEVWVPAVADRALLEQLLRRMHLIRLRTSAKNRIFGCSRSGVCAPVSHICAGPALWTRSANAASRRSGAPRSPRRSRSSTCSTRGSRRSTLGTCSSPVTIRARRCYAPFPVSAGYLA